MTTYLERNVLVSETDLKFLTSVLVLLWPFRIILPVARVSYHMMDYFSTLCLEPYFKISLVLIMRLISSIIVELTHTVVHCQHFVD